jgi:hypothetical protein
MRLRFSALDDALIERVFQPVSNAMADHVGLERRRAACLCADAASVGWILSQARCLSDSVLGWDAASAVPRLLLLMLGLVALVGLRNVFLRASPGDANPLRLTMRPHRAVVLLMLVARMTQPNAAGLADFADMAMLGFAAAGLYLGACATRPPLRRAKARPCPAPLHRRALS